MDAVTGWRRSRGGRGGEGELDLAATGSSPGWRGGVVATAAQATTAEAVNLLLREGALVEVGILQGLVARAAVARDNPVDDAVFVRQGTKLEPV